MKKAVILFVLLALPFVALAQSQSAKTLIRKDVQDPAGGSFGTCQITDDGKVAVKNDSTQFLRGASTVDVVRINSLIASLPSEESAYQEKAFAVADERRPKVRTSAYRRANGKSETINLYSQGCIYNLKTRKCTDQDGSLKNTSPEAQELLQIVKKVCR